MNDTSITQVFTLLTLIAGILAQIYRERKKRRDDVEDRRWANEERQRGVTHITTQTAEQTAVLTREIKVGVQASGEALTEANGTKREIADLQRQILHLQRQQPTPATAATAQRQAAQIDTIESETKQHTAQLDEIQKAVE